MSLVHSFCVEGYPKSQQILMVPCMFLMLPCMAFCGAACLRRTGHGMLRDWKMDKVHDSGT